MGPEMRISHTIALVYRKTFAGYWLNTLHKKNLHEVATWKLFKATWTGVERARPETHGKISYDHRYNLNYGL